MRLKKTYRYLSALLLLSCCALYLFPYLFSQVIVWQREFNQLMSAYLHQIKQSPATAGGLLIGVSFLYGVFHALGPGHGKFIIASYLSTHRSQLKSGMTLSLLSSIMQGIVAIAATSVIVVLLNLSSAYFKLSQLWLERVAFGLILLLGLYWIYQSAKTLYRLSAQKKGNIRRIYTIKPLSAPLMQESAVKKMTNFSAEQPTCACGHQHIPTARQLEKTDNRSRLLVILSIGMRPCSGAIFVLFLAYMLDLYIWGMFAVLAMSVGTGLTLSAFALLVQYARENAVKLGQWYVSPGLKEKAEPLFKLAAGGILIFFAAALIYGTTLPLTGGAALFGG
ncbi:zinc transporter permease subunit ZevB [Caviibacterium pharyngocola]|uniref:Nickel/cobalt efflux system n=1 Tax=Caviibacterium pharyngocola TaxID=28159 RepID=A0A2M8RSN7_9PAST|nr:zinc transporter permease subunit ZevB [Caviibacterium pharyngocola]PJG81896.1 cobalt transporter [Caviibacterium pharyngocola]